MRLVSAFIVLIAMLTMSPKDTYGGEKKSVLGNNNFSVKLDSIHFSDDIDSSYYIGVEGYKALTHHLSIGVEVGYSDTDSDVPVSKIDSSGVIEGLVDSPLDTEVVFVPIELNLKYSTHVFSHFVVDFGGGFTYIYVSEEITDFDDLLSDFFLTPDDLGIDDELDEWLWGAQFFADLNYTVRQFFFGINAKYQLTDKGKDTGHSYDNWRVGGQVGVMF
jgi:hypothetical protein